jgi:hypothetical protein
MIAVFAVLGGGPYAADSKLWQSEPARRPCQVSCGRFWRADGSDGLGIAETILAPIIA